MIGTPNQRKSQQRKMPFQSHQTNDDRHACGKSQRQSMYFEKLVEDDDTTDDECVVEEKCVVLMAEPSAGVCVVAQYSV